MSQIVLMSDPAVEQVPVVDCAEPLVDLRGRFAFANYRTDERGDYAHVRFGLAQQLLSAQEQLIPRGLQLLIVEGYRPPALQQAYFGDYQDKLHAEHPDWAPGQLRDMASRFVAPPETAGHVTGGAVDLTLADADGRELDMGCRVNANPEESGGLCYLLADGLTNTARENRMVLRAVLLGAGLVNYPCEYWHWSLGDKYASALSGASAAWYGPYDRTGL